MARSKKPPRVKETLFEERHRMRQEAIALAAKHTNKKPTKFLLK